MKHFAHVIRINRWLVFSVVSLLLPLVIISGASADPMEITITPTTATPYIDPGTTHTGTLQVLNQGTAGYSYTVYTTPYHVSGEDYTPDFTLLPNAPKVDSWFHLSIPGGYIKPGQVVSVKYSISVPAHTLAGGYYAAVFAEAKSPKTANIVLSERVGELFYIQVAGPVVKKGELLSWQSGFLQTPPLTSAIRIQDNGSIFFPSQIHYEVDDILGRPKFSLSTEKELLPQSVRRITISWNGSPPIGLFKVSGSASFLGQSHELPARWVLVMSNTARFVCIALFAVILALLLGRGVYKTKAKREKLDKER